MKLSAVNGTWPVSMLVHDAADGVDVDAVIERLALRLLGRHVLGRAEDHPGLRQARRRPSSSGSLDLGDAEVEHLDEVGDAPRAR